MSTKTKKEEERAALKARKQQEQEFLIEFIQMMETYPSLWNTLSEIYHDREKKSADYNKVLDKYREYYTEATLAQLKSKWNTLRTNYRAELKKEGKRRSGSGGDEVYTSDKWYFRPMNFLRDHEIPAASISSMTPFAANEEHNMGTIDTQEDASTVSDDDILSSAGLSVRAGSSRGTDSGLGSGNQKRLRKRSQYDAEETKTKLLKIVCDKLDHAGDRSRYQPDEDVGLPPQFLHMAKSWAYKLAKVSNNRLLFAEKAINDILFEAAQGHLRRDSVYINLPIIEEFVP